MADIERNAAISRFLRRATEFVWPFGAFQKTNDPHKAIENLERASAVATLWILIGIFGDIGVLLWFPHNQLERLAGVAANALIGIGLIVEYLVVGRVIDATKEAERESNERIAKIEERTAEANAKANEAELATQRLVPRKFEAEEFAKKLEGKKKAPVEIFFIRYDDEANSLAFQIKRALVEASWEVLDLASKSEEEIIRCIPLAKAPPTRFLVVTTRIENEQQQLKFEAAKFSLRVPGGKADVPFLTLFLAVRAIKGRLRSATLYGVDPRQLDAPPIGAVRVIIGPKA